jgi:hypothetical protein
MHNLLHHSPENRLKILPLARRLLGPGRPNMPYLLELLAIFAMQRNVVRAEDFGSGTAYNAYCRKRCREVTELQKVFARFTALRGQDEDLVEANVQKALSLRPDTGEGWSLAYTPTTGSNYRTAIIWLVERACVNLEHRQRQAKKDADKAFFAAHEAAAKVVRQRARLAKEQAKAAEYAAREAQMTPQPIVASAPWPFDDSEE